MENKNPHTSAEAKNRYRDKTYDLIQAAIPKGMKEKFREECEKKAQQ